MYSPSASPPSHLSQLELSIAARKLVNRDTGSKSDPFCIMYGFSNKSGKWVELGRTEVIKDNLNPDWVKKFIIPYKFNEVQPIKFEIWDYDQSSGDDFLGQLETHLAQIVATNGGTLKKPLLNSTTFLGKKRRFGGEIHLRVPG